jgi:hypothetical protein
VGDGIGHIAGASLAFGTDHRRTLSDPAQGLAKIGGAAHKWHREPPFVDVVGVVGGGQHFGLVDVVNTE